MALTDILQKIKEKTKEKVREIEQGARQEITKINERYEKEITAKKEKILKAVKEEAEKKIKHSQIRFSLETKNLILSEKQKILDLVYERVLKELETLKDDDYSKLITKLIKKCPTKGEIIPAKGREKITQKAIKESKKELDLAKNSLPIRGGFIFNSKNLEIDFCFENLVKEIREETETEVAKIIFK